MDRGHPCVVLLDISMGLDRKLSNLRCICWLESMQSNRQMYEVGTCLVFILCRRRSLTVLGKAAWVSRKRMEATFFFLQASLIFWATRCMASVVHLPG